jgi:hypothetical protein
LAVLQLFSRKLNDVSRLPGYTTGIWRQAFVFSGGDAVVVKSLDLFTKVWAAGAFAGSDMLW